MRFVLPWLVLASCATAFDADGCSVAPGYIREAEFEDYDQRHAQWRESVGRRLATDADTEVAWAGAIIASAQTSGDDAKPALPMPPTTGLGRLLRATYCKGSGHCPAALDAWIAAEPDNAFVRSLARDDLGDAAAWRSHGGIDATTRYDDYFLASRALSDKITRLAGEPPPEPERYVSPPCSFMHGSGIAGRIDALVAMASLGAEDLEHDDTLDDTARLHLAKLMVAAKGSPVAAQVGAALGVAAARSPAERKRYCQLNERAILQADVGMLAWIMDEPDAERLGVRRLFFDALRTRNAVDAVDAVAAQLPASRRPDPVDPERIAACVAGSD